MLYMSTKSRRVAIAILTIAALALIGYCATGGRW